MDMDRYKKLAIEHYRYYKLIKNSAFIKQAKAALNEYKLFYSPV